MKSAFKEVNIYNALSKVELPPSSYALADLGPRSLKEGIVKYHEQRMFHSVHDFYSHLGVKDTHLFNDLVCNLFLKRLPGLTNVYKRFSDEKILDLMTHNQRGELRPETSTGYLFGVKRKVLARVYGDEVREWLKEFDCSIVVYAIACLKDEFRDKKKAARSIMVFQIYIWLIYQRHFGCILEYLSRVNPGVLAFGHSVNHVYFTEKLRGFDWSAETHSIDLKKQDSRFGAWWVCWFMDFLFSHTNYKNEARNEMMWCMNESFFEKKLIDMYGNVLTFENGELSGFPGTIVFNSFYSLFFFVVSDALLVMNEGFNPNTIEYPLCVLGDDVLVQFKHFSVYEFVTSTANHELYHDVYPCLEEADFLSLKYHRKGPWVLPYYMNLDKMYASLRYSSAGGVPQYFGKVCSFINLLRYAPLGSPEYDMLLKLVSVAKKMMVMFDDLNPRCFQHPVVARRNILGLMTVEEDLIKFQSRPMPNKKKNVKPVAAPAKRGKNYQKNKRKREARKRKRAGIVQLSASNSVSAHSSMVPWINAKLDSAGVEAENRDKCANLLRPTVPFRIPRVNGAACAAQTLIESWTVTANASGYGAIAVVADPIRPIRSLVEYGSARAWSTTTNEQMHHINASDSNKRICLSHPLKSVGDQTLNAHVTTVPPGFYHYQTSAVQPNGARYNGNFSGDLVLAISNMSAITRNYAAGCVCYTSSSAYTIVQNAGVNLNAGQTANFTVPLDAATYGIGPFIMVTNGDDAKTEVAVVGVTAGSGFYWNVLPFMDASGFAVARTQYDKASGAVVTGLSCTVSNYNPEIYKNGRFACGEFPAGHYNQVPGHPAAMMEACAALPSIQKIVQMTAAQGADYNWCASELSQLEFEPPVEAGPAVTLNHFNKPVGLIVWKFIPTADFNGEMQVQCNMNLELQTTQRGNTVVPAPTELKNFVRWLQHCQHFNRFSSNDGHKTKIKNAVTAFVKDPRVWKTAMKLASYGLAAIVA